MAGLLDWITGAVQQQYAKGAPYREAVSGLLQGDPTKFGLLAQEFNRKAQTPEGALDIALNFAPLGIVKTFNGKNLNKPLLDKFIKTNKLSPDEFVMYEENAKKMAQEGLHNINIANAKANPYYEKYKSMFDADIYRGMRDDVMEMNPNVGQGARADTGVWASNVPYNASTYAGYNEGGVVYPLKLRSGDFATVDVGNKNWNRIPVSNNPIKDTVIRNADQTDISLSQYVDPKWEDWTDTNTIASIAKENPRNKGIIFENVRDIGPASQGINENKIQEFSDTYTIFDPSLIRSRFAAFDPLRNKSNDILAGLLAVPATSLMQPEDKKKKRKAK
jgi:hypothetical protein